MSKIIEFNSAAAMVRARETNINYILPDRIGDSATSLLILLGFRNLAQVAEKPIGYFLAIHGFGRKTVDKLEEVLSEHHLRFKPYLDNTGYAEEVDAYISSIKYNLDRKIEVFEKLRKAAQKFSIVRPDEP